ncbi:trypsin-like serine peptidase [Caulobacter hibisci]|uniref:Serine protease n=1 Tax=Caulobacter hibisci TaxID=2035993 RepID=A0ABS0T209_9CAUL|nr:trypsin-like peptidase domain-containing protein [Caulobacter hibisci]MBI1685854.1 trypsin-like peptidase domain-containing protein [Caulobacter hibisci]
MADKKTPSEALGESAVRSATDRATDPLFVPHPDSLPERLSGAEALGGDTYSELLESICGTTDDSQPVEQYNGALGVTTAFVGAHQAHACQVQWNANLASIYTNPGTVNGVRWGSGTMIADDILLTCGHLFDQTGGGWERPRVNGTTNIISPQDIARNMHLNFNFQVDPAGNPRAEQSFPILELLEYRLGGLDMAICRIGGNPGAIFGRALVSTTDAASPDMICVIGHPAGQRKRIEAGPTTAIDGNLIRYNDIDTLGGNSGSGIWRASDGRIVGVHTNGGCNAASPAGGGSNFGQRIAAVIAVSPTLQRITRPIVKLKVLDDPIATLKVRDDLKLKVVDDPISTLKFRDDGIPKRKVLDDVKQPGLDKIPGGENKSAGFDDPGRFDPGRVVINPAVLNRALPEGAQARPFILSTPHHSEAWNGTASATPTGQDEAAQVEAALGQLAEHIAAAEAELQQLDNQYRQLLAHYQALVGQGG